jgi:hypothetical protein
MGGSSTPVPPQPAPVPVPPFSQPQPFIRPVQPATSVKSGTLAGIPSLDELVSRPQGGPLFWEPSQSFPWPRWPTAPTSPVGPELPVGPVPSPSPQMPLPGISPGGRGVRPVPPEEELPGRER